MPKTHTKKQIEGSNQNTIIRIRAQILDSIRSEENKQNKVPYDLDYALMCLRESIDYAETDHDFQPARKWVNEVELSAAQAGLAEKEMLSAACLHENTARVTGIRLHCVDCGEDL